MRIGGRAWVRGSVYGRRLVRGLLALGFVAALGLQVPAQLGDARVAMREAGLWLRPDDQYRAILGDVPYDLLREADLRMPRDAAVLLVTPGTDVRHREYTTFHRALYFLAPRPVRWITPAPGDGTWEARWWTTTGLDAASICRAADVAGATEILLLDLGPPSPACEAAEWTVEALPDGMLVHLTASRPLDPGPPPLPAWWPVSLLVALAIPLVIGAAIVSRALGRRPASSAALRAALAWIAGTGVLTLAELGLGALGVPRPIRVAILALAGVAAGGWLIAGRRGPAEAKPTEAKAADAKPASASPAHRLATWGLRGVVASEIGLVALLALGRPLSVWDGWAHWGEKARAIFLESGVTEAVYADATRASTHLGYPLHVPLLESWVYTWLGTPDDRLVGVVGLATFVALLALCYGALRDWGAGQLGALAIVAVLGSLVHVWRLAAAGYADVPLALLMTAAAVLVVRWLEGGPPGALVLGAGAAGLMGWTKMEGVVLLVVLIGILAVLGVVSRAHAIARRARLAALALAVAGTLGSGAWWAFVLAGRHSGPEYVFSVGEALANAGRIPTIVEMQLSMLGWTDWSFVWLAAVGLAAFEVARRRAGRPAADQTNPDLTWLLPASAVLVLLLMSCAYLITEFAPYTEQIEASGFRLALQVLPVTLLWMGRTILLRPRPPAPEAS